MAKGITREKIVDAALDVLDENGIDGLTVRALAARLDVRPPALYWHVRNKQELLDEMSTTVMGRVGNAAAQLPPGDTWRDDLEAYAGILRAQFLRHRDGARTFSGTRLTDPATVRMKEPWLARWMTQGITLTDADEAIDLVLAFVVGFVIEEQERAQSAVSDPGRYSAEGRDEWLGPDAPLVTEAGHLRDDDDDARFERQLGILLDGVSVRVARGRGGQDAGSISAR